MLFTINRGKHKCSPRPWKILDSSKSRVGTFVLHNSCWYDTAKYGTHLNKLVGVGCDLINNYSYRLAWRPAPDQYKYEMYLYLHIAGKWVRSVPMKEDLCGIITGETMNTYAFTPDGEVINALVNGDGVERHFPYSLGTGWFMDFYFGGTPTAPWIMQADVTMEGVIT